MSKKRVTIVGFTPHRNETAWDDEGMDIWGLNGLYEYKDCKRFTAWFDLHPVEVINPKRLQAYSEMVIPVYLIEPHPGIATSVAFPREDVIKALPQVPEKGSYWTNSVSWMVALAICLGYEEIHINGVDMSEDSEYRHQRANLEMVCGIAMGMGREIHVPKISDLFSATHEYGFQHDAGMRGAVKARQKKDSERITHLDRVITAAVEEQNVLKGRLSVYHWFMQRGVADWMSMTPDHPDKEAEVSRPT